MNHMMKTFALALLAASAVAQARLSFLSPCDIPGVKEKARCGTVEVWENCEAKSGRRIGLKVVVLPATGSPREPDAITFLAGGPGEPATSEAPDIATFLPALREHHDLLFVDQRGTGGSHALECDLYPGKDPQSALGAFFPADQVRACRAALGKVADLRMYTTAPSMDDLDEVRAALGYDKLDLFGDSYGTRAALVYIHRHPTHVRVAVLQGVTPPSDLIPLRFPRYAQNSIDSVFAGCRAEAACVKAFPDLSGDLRAILERTAAKPVPVEILDPQTGEPIHVALSRNLLGESLRYLLYQAGTALYVPDLVHQAASGDFAPLAEFALASRRELVNGIGQGLYLSVTCSEDLPLIKPADAEREARNTFLGEYRYGDQSAACDAWVRGPIPSDFHQPIRAQTPVLLISGSWDPVTPISDAQEAAATLPHSLSIVIPAGSHGDNGLPGADACIASIANQFVEHGGAEGIDTSCVTRLHRAPFPTEPVETKALTLTAAQQAALTGHYTAEGGPALDIALEHGKLIARMQGETGQYALAAVSPTRLRLLGLFGVYLDVATKDGHTVVTLDSGGASSLTWTRGD